MRTSTKIALGFVLVAAGLWTGYQLYSSSRSGAIKWVDLQPGRLNLLGISEHSNFYPIHSNKLVYLVEGVVKSESKADGRKIPLHDVLETLQGNTEALSKLSNFIFKIDPDKFPHKAVIWTFPQVQKALNGDQQLSAQLENDLNIKLDGTPLPHIKQKAFENGILIQTPITVAVPALKGQQLKGYILEPYRPLFAKHLERRLQKCIQINPKTLQENYHAILRSPSKQENVMQSLQHYVSSKRIQNNSKLVERFLQNFKIILTEKFILSANNIHDKAYQSSRYSYLKLKLSNEGYMRLWKYTRDHKDAKLLLTFDGVGVASPELKGELLHPEITLTSLPNQKLTATIISMIQQANTQSLTSFSEN